MLLTHIPDVIGQNTSIQYAYQLYEVMIDGWLDRETYWVDKGALQSLSERLAENIYLHREQRGAEHVSLEELEKLTDEWGIELQPWQIAGRSLLNRDAEGNNKFAHRSIMEYLFVKRLLALPRREREPVALTDQMRMFLTEMAQNPAATELDFYGVQIQGAPTDFSMPDGSFLETVWIGPGTFVMGSPEKESGRDLDEGPQREVTISQGFYLGKYTITQGQWKAVMGTKPWAGQSSVQDNPDHPAVYISWEDVQSFIEKLSEAAGSSVYRLPTEAEWEYACRARTTTRWSFGDEEGGLGDYAWYSENGGRHAQAVGTKESNSWGLYDMHGNVWEWCWDWFGNYKDGAGLDPQGPASGSSRVMRGGSFYYPAQFLRSAIRFHRAPGNRGSLVGVRLLRTE